MNARRTIAMTTALLGALVLLMTLPDVAFACPVCFDPRAENRMAFLGTALFMTVMPLGMVAGAGLWVRSRFRDAEPEDGPVEDPESADRSGDA